MNIEKELERVRSQFQSRAGHYRNESSAFIYDPNDDQTYSVDIGMRNNPWSSFVNRSNGQILHEN